jgi:hypothetical protein
MDFNGMPLQVSITSESGTPFSPTPPASRDQTTSQFYNTNILSCDSYELTLVVDYGQHMHIDHFDFVPCGTLVNGSQSATASVPAASSSAAVSNPSTSPLSASASSPKSLSAGLIAGLVLSSFLLVLMLGGVALLLFMRRRRRQRSSSDPGLWSNIPDRGEPKSPSQALLSVGGGIGGVKDRPRTRFGLYMFKFKPASDTLMRDPSPLPAEEGNSPIPGPAPAPPQVWFDPSVEKPPRYTGDDWAADTESGGQVLSGYLPDSKEWIAQELEGVEQGSSSEWSSVPTNRAVESVSVRQA